MKDYNYNDFQQAIKENKFVLVDFYAAWCGPCKMLAPIIVEVAEALKGEALVIKVNVEEEKKLASEYRVSSIPTIILFKNGTPIETAIGYRTKDVLVNMVRNHLNK